MRLGEDDRGRLDILENLLPVNLRILQRLGHGADAQLGAVRFQPAADRARAHALGSLVNIGEKLMNHPALDCGLSVELGILNQFCAQFFDRIHNVELATLSEKFTPNIQIVYRKNTQSLQRSYTDYTQIAH